MTRSLSHNESRGYEKVLNNSPSIEARSGEDSKNAQNSNSSILKRNSFNMGGPIYHPPS
jgi:hypothetical protein